MKNSTNFPLMTLGLALLLNSCGMQNQKTAANAESTTTAASSQAEVITGNDRDTHGCIGSAGYQWSEVRQKCIRIFEAGTQLISATDPNATTAAYLVFGTDSLQAELFMPGRTPYVLQRRSLPQGGYAWNIEDDDTPNVRITDGQWLVEQRGKPLYRQQKK